MRESGNLDEALRRTLGTDSSPAGYRGP